MLPGGGIPNCLPTACLCDVDFDPGSLFSVHRDAVYADISGGDKSPTSLVGPHTRRRVGLVSGDNVSVQSTER